MLNNTYLNDRNKFNYLFLFLLLISVVNYGMHIIIILIICMFFFDKMYKKISLIELLFIKIFIIYGIFSFFIYDTIDIKLYLITFFYCLLMFFCSRILRVIPLNILINSISFVLFFFVIISVIQYIGYSVFKKYIDFHYILTLGKYESRIESSALSGFGLIRATALTIEPSNLSSLLAYLMCIYFYLLGLKGVKGRNVLLLLPTISLSFTAIFLFSIAYIGNYFINEKNFFKKIIFVIPISILLGRSGYYILDYRINAGVDYDALAFRSVILNVLEKSTVESFFWGHGIYMSEIPLNLYDETIYHSHIRDTGLVFNLIFTFGIPLTVLFYYILLRKMMFISKTATLIFVILSFLKFDYMQPVFWLCIFMILSFDSSSKRY